MKKGMVYLVGAGSGDPALLTQKGQQYLQLADLVVYDALASVSILNHVRPDCELISLESEQETTVFHRQKSINCWWMQQNKASRWFA